MIQQITVADFDVRMMTPIFKTLLYKVNRDEREDVKSIAVLKVLEGIQKGAVKKDLFSYAYSIVKFVVVDHIRRNNRKINRASTLVNFCDGADEEVGGSADYFCYKVEEPGYEVSIVRADYEANIQKFSPQQRKIVEYMIYKEEGMDIPPGGVAISLGLNKCHASRAMAKMQKFCHA
ncbi:RNA polymerase sigma factor [Paenibacillus massiliensis]|uniref:RNA polymerase sigma factor n=1 Tax=Paenibacillus massiliensis TaxID=225917 RepID=UPI00036828D0|nr:hypothetical protein [Paenibacillus massiliensis]